MNKFKNIISKWGDDVVAGVGYSSLASWFKYVFHHFIDIGWTVTAAIAVMLATHYGKKYLIPWLDKKFKL